ncbi:hypothetical protein ACEYYA_02370 [Paracoccus sp. p3-h83]|uniref:hypothetical protein n=1 Tax=Paracoccus sp. p3-h83 TaxID=3342805 RepID=UPI0035B9454E
MIAPIDDPRLFAEVLGDWMVRHDLSAYAVAKIFGARQGVTVSRWLDGGRVTYEPALRRAMTWVDHAGAFKTGS